MAKHAKRKGAKKTTHRRRRIGAATLNPASPLVQYGSIALGFILGPKIDAALTKVIPANIDAKIVAGAEIGLGALLAFKKGPKKLPTTVIGGLLIGAGAKKAMTAFGIGAVGGYQMVPAVGGYGNVPAVGAPVKRIGGYMPGATGLSGYPVARQSVGAVAAGAGLMDSDFLS